MLILFIFFSLFYSLTLKEQFEAGKIEKFLFEARWRKEPEFFSDPDFYIFSKEVVERIVFCIITECPYYRKDIDIYLTYPDILGQRGIVLAVDDQLRELRDFRNEKKDMVLEIDEKIKPLFEKCKNSKVDSVEFEIT